MKNTNVVTQTTNQTVTVKTGGVPIIGIKSKDGEDEAMMAINFLRSGCPEIQLIIKNGHEALLGTLEKMRDLMIALQLPKERRFWLFGKPKLEKGGSTVLFFRYHPLSKYLSK